MSEITLTDEQYVKAVGILWNAGQFRKGRLVCDEDDIHEYLSEAGMLDRSLTHPDYDWLSDESIDRLYETVLDYSIQGFPIAS